MIARFRLLLPFTLTVAPTEELDPVDFEIEGYAARFYPPYRSSIKHEDLEMDSDVPLITLSQSLTPLVPLSTTGNLLMNGQETFQADALQVDFFKPEFDRRIEMDDPPTELVFRTVNSFLERLRLIGRAGWLKPLTFDGSIWRLQYLRDDESEFEHDPALKRARGGAAFQIRAVGMSRELWQATHDLPAQFRPRPWETLSLDAWDALPEIGPALVLAFAAIETRIATALDVLAEAKGVSPEFWEWLRDRGGQYQKEPSVAEQLDQLLKELGGRSLKGETSLWEGFMNLKGARNTFVHEGVAKVGTSVVDRAMCMGLIRKADEILDWIEALLPAEERRTKVNLSTEMQSLRMISAPEETTEGGP